MPLLSPVALRTAPVVGVRSSQGAPGTWGIRTIAAVTPGPSTDTVTAWRAPLWTNGRRAAQAMTAVPVQTTGRIVWSENWNAPNPVPPYAVALGGD
jgi:hypothetical protein